MRRVEAADIEGGVGFRITELLRLGETFAKGNLLRLHAGEDVIAGAVEDAVDARDLIAGEAVAQGLDDRNAAGNRRLEAERHALGLGEPGEMKPVLGDQRLVGGDDGFAVAERRLDRSIGHAIRAADQFDEDIDVGRARQSHGIAEPVKAGEIEVARLVAALRRDRGDSDLTPRSRRQSGGLTVEKLDERGADSAKTGDAKAQGRRHPKIQLNRRNPGQLCCRLLPHFARAINKAAGSGLSGRWQRARPGRTSGPLRRHRAAG